MNAIRRQSAMPLASSFAAICLGSLTMSIFAHDAMAGTLVVVPAGFEEMEGNHRGFPNPHWGQTVIVQEVHPASEFPGVPTEMTQIVGMRLRPDHSTTPREISMTYELRLSTTDAVPGNLDPVFENNRGDDYVVVYLGPTVWATEALGPVGGPQPFDYVVDFQTPFAYYPSSGMSLLVEEYITVDDENRPGRTDAHQFPGSDARINLAFAPADTAGLQLFSASIRQFEFVSAPSGDIDGDGDVDGFDFIVWQQNPSMGNLSDWQANYGLPITASSATVPAPASITLVLVFVGLSTARRRRYLHQA